MVYQKKININYYIKKNIKNYEMNFYSTDIENIKNGSKCNDKNLVNLLCL